MTMAGGYAEKTLYDKVAATLQSLYIRSLLVKRQLPEEHKNEPLDKILEEYPPAS
jgi:hypothetical protein